MYGWLPIGVYMYVSSPYVRPRVPCFHPANSFRVLTQYLFYAQIVEHSSFAFVNLNQPLSQSGDVWGFSGWAQDRAGVRYNKTLLLHVCMYVLEYK